jgi:hypothetical protein
VIERSKKQRLLELVPEDGTSISNASLRTRLGLPLDEYQALRDELVGEGAIEPWQGRGGTVRRKRAEIAKPALGKARDAEKEEKEAASKRRSLELQLCPPFFESLRLWAKDQGWTDHVVNHSASQGRRNTGGTWTRPDFVVIGYRKFEDTLGIVRDAGTFEVKTSTCGIAAVFETAAHSRVATKS